MESITINGQVRTDLGKKATNHLRKNGNIPCNLYGGEGNLNFFAPYSDFRKVIYTSDFRTATILVDGKTYTAIVKEIQFDPVKDTIKHIDFQELVTDTKVKISVPLKLIGTPKGAGVGGKLEQVMRRLSVFALPKHLPKAIEIDVTEMDLGNVKRVSDIQIEGLTILNAASNPVCRMSIPRAVKEEAAKDAKAAAKGAAPAKVAAPAKDAKK